MPASRKTTPVTDINSELKVEDQLCFALYSVSRAITRQYTVLLDGLGVTYPQYLAMLVLWEQDGISAQEMATRLELEQATTTPLVQRLEKLGLVKRSKNKQDERRIDIFLTGKGRSLHKKAVDIPNGISCATGVNKSTARNLVKELNKIKTFITENNTDS